jgi:polysaccharide export outer membrane protein
MTDSMALRAIAALFLLAVQCGVASIQGHAQASGTSPSTTSAPQAIRIGPGDLLDVTVFDTPDISAHARVSQNGDINLPVYGFIHVAGLSTEEAASSIENALRDKGLLLEPHVTISIAEYASQGATMTGEIRTPGIYPTLGSRTLMDMIALAGGLQATAGKSVSIIHRDDPQHPETVALQASVASMSAQENPIIRPGDTVVIGKAGIIYIIGDVTHPGGFLIDNNERLSLIQVLALAGGATRTAATGSSHLIRKVPEGREDIPLDLKKILNSKNPDFKLSDGDILVVPSSNIKTFGYRGIEAAIALTTGLAIYKL